MDTDGDIGGDMKPTALGPQGVRYEVSGDELDETLIVHRASFAMGIVKPSNDTEEFYYLRALRRTGLPYPEAVAQSERAYASLIAYLDQRHLTTNAEGE